MKLLRNQNEKDVDLMKTPSSVFFLTLKKTQELSSKLIFSDGLVLMCELNRIYFQQDGAPPHNARINTNWLNTTFNDRWIGTYGPIRWPALSLDLTPLDFWLWGYIQDQVYLTPPVNEENLRQRIIRVCREIPPILYSIRPMPCSEDARHVLITPTANLSSTCRRQFLRRKCFVKAFMARNKSRKRLQRLTKDEKLYLTALRSFHIEVTRSSLNIFKHIL
ncbi:hypothetical protein NQ318_017487 [Aromia moschata]|uniref:Transposable element Tc3 transposase n=1 Tax=Aromia moschata TaxID=1265417 RepID=A0AAV8Z2I8_9CUCU|nr:hypothetical protein NQ318_017487 [Aromia moschata]